MIAFIKLNHLRNGEFIQFISNTIDLIEGRGEETLQIVSQLNALKEKLAGMEPLFNRDQKNPVTREVVRQDQRRCKALEGIRRAIRAFCNHYNPDISRAANQLDLHLKQFGKKVTRQNLQEKTALIGVITDHWEGNPELAAALELLGLTLWKEELKSANKAFNDSYLERTIQYAAANTATMKQKREETMAVYSDLRKHLSALAVIDQSETTRNIINDLNAIIMQYKMVINGRQNEDSQPVDQA